jgi:hypothetical protein
MIKIPSEKKYVLPDKVATARGKLKTLVKL